MGITTYEYDAEGDISKETCTLSNKSAQFEL